MLARLRRQEALDRAVARRLGDGQLVVVAAAHQAEVLGQRHQHRPGGGGARDQPAAASRLRATSGVDTICKAAIFILGASFRGG